MTCICDSVTWYFNMTFTLHRMGRMEIIFCVILCLFYEALCEKNTIKSKNPLPYFRRQVEEVFEETSTQCTVADDMHSNIVSFLIKNVKEIYNEVNEHDLKDASSPMPKVFAVHTSTISSISDDISDDAFNDISDDTVEDTKSVDSVEDTTDDAVEDKTASSIDTELITKICIKTDISFLRIRTVTDISKITSELNSSSIENINEGDVFISSTTVFDSGNNENADENDVLASYKNATLIPFSDKELININPATTVNELAEKKELMHLSKNLILFETDRKERGNEPEPENSFNATKLVSSNKSITCIYCNNVALENCNDPENRLIPSTECERSDDLCYSQHTPFGVIDRGCFNVNHNLTTYVCSCNLCNYIAISEMPYIFSEKGNWAYNVIELSRTKQFRNSVLKDMTCLRCETNTTANAEKFGHEAEETLKVEQARHDANCLEGNVISLSTQTCKQNEVCAVKAVRKEGYIWRGCVKFPKYNYWWKLCDSDLCNFDPIVSVYDPDKQYR